MSADHDRLQSTIQPITVDYSRLQSTIQPITVDYSRLQSTTAECNTFLFQSYNRNGNSYFRNACTIVFENEILQTIQNEMELATHFTYYNWYRSGITLRNNVITSGGHCAQIDWCVGMRSVSRATRHLDDLTFKLMFPELRTRYRSLARVAKVIRHSTPVINSSYRASDHAEMSWGSTYRRGVLQSTWAIIYSVCRFIEVASLTYLLTHSLTYLAYFLTGFCMSLVVGWLDIVNWLASWINNVNDLLRQPIELSKQCVVRFIDQHCHNKYGNRWDACRMFRIMIF